MAVTTKRARQCKEGFDAIANALDNLLFDQLSSKRKGSLGGVANTAYKHLKSSFAKSLKGISKGFRTPAADVNSITPSHSNRPRRSIERPLDVRLSPVPYRNDEAIANRNASIIATPRLDECLVPLTAANRGMERLRSKDILRLRVGDQLTLVFPPTHPSNDDVTNKQRSDLLSRFKGSSYLDLLA